MTVVQFFCFDFCLIKVKKIIGMWEDFEGLLALATALEKLATQGKSLSELTFLPSASSWELGCQAALILKIGGDN